MFELTLAGAEDYLVNRGVLAAGVPVELGELPGGVSATVIAVRVPSTGGGIRRQAGAATAARA